MALIDDLHRLDRAGSEHSRTSRKLADACRSLADHISDQVIGFPCSLPFRSDTGTVFQQYSVVEDASGYTWLAVTCEPPDGMIDEITTVVRDWDREQRLAFAKDVASGLLPAISKWLEERAEEADRFADIVNTEAPE